MQDKLLTTAEVAEVLRCGVPTIRRYIKTRKFKNCIWVGKQFLIPQSDLEEFIENNNIWGKGRID